MPQLGTKDGDDTPEALYLNAAPWQFCPKIAFMLSVLGFQSSVLVDRQGGRELSTFRPFLTDPFPAAGSKFQELYVEESNRLVQWAKQPLTRAYIKYQKRKREKRKEVVGCDCTFSHK